MKSVYEPAREIPVAGEYDVIAAGAGPAGVSAAVTAARNGARVLLIEAGGAPGGISTCGLMSHFTGTVNSSLYREILTRMAEKNEGEGHGKVVVQIDPEKLKNVYWEMLLEAGVDVRLYTFVCGALTEGNRVTGIVTESKSGREAFLGEVTVDGTGDGDVAARAGAAFTLGRESDGKMQPCTLMFKIAGVDTEHAVFLGSFESTFRTPRGELQALAREHLPFPAGHVLTYRSTLPGIVTLNMTNAIGIDGTNADDLTRAERICRSQMEAIVEFLREYVPGYEHCYIISAGSMMGVRETRHFHGVRTLTEDDILAARVFDDWVVRDAAFNFDVHNITGAGLDKTGVQDGFPQRKGYTIPYGCLVPEKLDGLLLSGRNISGTHMAHSNFRVMPICVGIGEAGGAAAAIAVRRKIDLRDVDPKEIQEILTQKES